MCGSRAGRSAATTSHMVRPFLPKTGVVCIGGNDSSRETYSEVSFCCKLISRLAKSLIIEYPCSSAKLVLSDQLRHLGR